MAENWIKKLADEQLTREKEQAAEQGATDAARQTFDAAAVPFWADVQSELRRVVAEYNEAIGREDLVFPAETDRTRPGRFEIHRGNLLEGYCYVDLYNHGRCLTVEYSWKDRGSSHHGEMRISLVQDEHGIRAEIAGGSPADVAKEILSRWAAHFGKRPPGR